MSVHQRAIVITGASSGIGRATALHLDQLGFRVFAGVRREADGRALVEDASDKLTPILLDVTDDGSIATAVRSIADATAGGLFGLVNNAGLSLNGPLELVPVPEMKKLMDVNVIGLLAVTKAFLPLLRESRGRIINISSVNGELSIPTSGIYSASKFALEAISDALRMELKPWGIHVSVVQPGVTSTDIRAVAMDNWGKRHEQLPEEKQNLYESLFAKSTALIENIEKTAAGHEDVTKSVIDALSSDTPYSRSMVGPDSQQWKEIINLPDDKRDEVLLSFWS